MTFSFDPAKARSNLLKHGISFEEAQTIFLDPLAFTVYDEAHSEWEHREITVGLSALTRLLCVVHTERTDGETRYHQRTKSNRRRSGAV